MNGQLVLPLGLDSLLQGQLQNSLPKELMVGRGPVSTAVLVPYLYRQQAGDVLQRLSAELRVVDSLLVFVLPHGSHPFVQLELSPNGGKIVSNYTHGHREGQNPDNHGDGGDHLARSALWGQVPVADCGYGDHGPPQRGRDRLKRRWLGDPVHPGAHVLQLHGIPLPQLCVVEEGRKNTNCQGQIETETIQSCRTSTENVT
mmetsp:Transcript_83737/g.224030  ORF Transcript_83737/g.224030 Transcript_83737/m.224030 type:complete len:201 (-) Transcript_83737:204-806(-)